MSTSWALAFATISLVLSLVNLAWQVSTWRLGRPVVKVTATDVRVGGDDRPLTAIQAQNVGGMAVTITNGGFRPRFRRWQWRKRRGVGGFIVIPEPTSPTLPHRLEAGDQAVFILLRSAVREGIAAYELGASPWAHLATGRTRVGRRYEPFTPSVSNSG